MSRANQLASSWRASSHTPVSNNLHPLCCHSGRAVDRSGRRLLLFLVHANKDHELKFRLIHHSGWGTYYFEFYDNEDEFLFALSEGGHIAGLGSLVSGNADADHIIKDYNLREDLLAGTSIRDCKQKLKNLYRGLGASINAKV